MIYLASPYSHEDPRIMNQRFEDVCRIAAELISQGLVVFSPIAHSASIATRAKLPTNWEFWMEQDLPFLKCCSRLMVCDTMQGWAASKGIAEEIKVAGELDIPVEYLSAYYLSIYR